MNVCKYVFHDEYFSSRFSSCKRTFAKQESETYILCLKPLINQKNGELYEPFTILSKISKPDPSRDSYMTSLLFGLRKARAGPSVTTNHHRE